MRGSHPCAWHSAAATCGAAVALSALASLLGDWGRSPQQAGACLTLWSEVPEENWPFLLKILAMSVMGAGDALAMSPRRLPSFSQPWLAMAFGQSPARAVFWPDFASIWRFRQLSETLLSSLKRPAGVAVGQQQRPCRATGIEQFNQRTVTSENGSGCQQRKAGFGGAASRAHTLQPCACWRCHSVQAGIMC